MRVDAVVLAGRANDGRLKECSPEAWEALIDVCGKPMLQRVIDALEGSTAVGDVVVVGPKALGGAIEARRMRLVEPGNDMVGNVMLGFQALSGRARALVTTSDVPMITPATVDGFLRECGEFEADFYYPVVRREVMEARFPGVRRTYAGMKEGLFTGGNMFLVELGAAEKLRRTLEFLVHNRKKPLRMAAVLGIPFTLKMLLKMLAIPEAEKKVRSLYGINARAVLTAFPEIGIDVDKPSDLSLVRAVLAG